MPIRPLLDVRNPRVVAAPKTARAAASAAPWMIARPMRQPLGRRLLHRAGDLLDHLADQLLVVALGHDADERLGARRADQDPAGAVELLLGVGHHRLDLVALQRPAAREA